MAYTIDGDVNLGGHPYIGIYHKPEFKEYPVYSNEGGLIKLPEDLSSEYPVHLFQDNNELVEVKDINLIEESEWNYYIDYPNSQIYVNESKSTKNFKIRGYWVGFSAISASRVVYKQSGNILKDIGELFDSGKTILKSLEKYGDATVVLEALDTKKDEAQTVVGNLNEKISLINTSDNHYYSIAGYKWQTNDTGKCTDYSYYTDIIHGFNTNSVICAIFDTYGIAIPCTTATYGKPNTNTVRIYSKVRSYMSIVLSFRFYNPQNSVGNRDVAIIKSQMEQALVDEVYDIIYDSLPDRMNAQSNRINTGVRDITRAIDDIAAYKNTMESYKSNINTTVNNYRDDVESYKEEITNAYQTAISFNGLKQCVQNINSGLVKSKVIKFTGNIKPTEPITLPQNIYIEGVGEAIIDCSGCNNVFRNATTSSHKEYTLKGGTIKGITFDGKNTTNNTSPIAFIHANGIRIEDCKFINFNNAWHCLEINACRDVWIKNNLFANIGTLNGNNTEVIQLDYAGTVEQYPFTDISLDNTHCSNVHIEDNNFRNIYTTTGVIGNHSYYSNGNEKYHKNIFIKGNCFEKCQCCYYLFDAKSVEINNNIFDHCNTGMKFKNQSGVMDMITVNGNTFIGDKYTKYFGNNSDGRFIWNIEDGKRIKGLTINNNTIKETTKHAIGGAFQDSNISNNSFVDIGNGVGYAIYLYGATRCMVLGNTGRDYASGSVVCLGNNSILITNECTVKMNAGGSTIQGSNVSNNVIEQG